MIRAIFTVAYVKAYIRRWKRILAAILTVIGIEWMLVEATAFFSDESSRQALVGARWVLAIFAVILGVIIARPKLRLCMSHLTDADLSVTVQASDILKSDGLIVVPTNTEYDMVLNGVAARATSVMGALIRGPYVGSAEHLQHDVNNALQASLENGSERKSEYPTGTCISITHSDTDYIVLAIDPLNVNRRSQGNYSSGETALQALWEYLRDNADRTTVSIPLVGTGRSRIANLSRKHAVKRIVKSFLLAASKSAFCDNLIICIQPDDYANNYFDLNDIKAWACCNAEYLREALAAGSNNGSSL